MTPARARQLVGLNGNNRIPANRIGLFFHRKRREMKMVVRLNNLHISGGKFGIQADRAVDIEARNIAFEGVELPWDIPGGRALIEGTRIRNDPKLHSVAKSRVGWTPQGAALPAKCDQCGTIFPSRNYGFRTSLFYGRDNEESCPLCLNEHAKVNDGIFDLTGEAVVLIAALMADASKAATLKDIAAQVLRGDTPPHEGLKLFSDFSNSLKPIAEGARKRGFNTAWFVGTFLAILVSAYFSLSSGEPIETEVSADRIHERCLEVTNSVQRSVIEQRKRESLNENSGIQSDSKPEAKPIPDHCQTKLSPKGPRLKKS